MLMYTRNQLLMDHRSTRRANGGREKDWDFSVFVAKLRNRKNGFLRAIMTVSSLILRT